MPSYWDANGNLVDGRYDVQLTGSNAKTIQTHNAVSLAASSISSNPTFIDCNGFKELAVTVMNDATTSSTVELYWSNDNVTVHGTEILASANTAKWRVGSTPIKARYLKVNLQNGDAAAHTMSAWAYLKV